MQTISATAAIWLAAINPAGAAQQWPIGVEREVAPGTYMQVIATSQGWRVWRSESVSGATCKAVKSARSRPHPVPIGLNALMGQGTPFVEITRPWSSSEFDYKWSARHSGDVEVQYRTIGARFWETADYFSFDAATIGEQPVELLVESWEYPEIGVGRVEERAIFDFAGLGWAQEQVLQCEDAIGDAIAAAPPQWARLPSPVFPDAALNAGVVAGEATLACTSNADGTLTSCTVVSESPLGFGFGPAALAASRGARTSPRPASAGARPLRYTTRFTQ